MPNEYKGFRIWPLEFQAMKTDTADVDTTHTAEGRLSIPSTGAKYWTEDDKGLAAFLEDFLKPMCSDTGTERDDHNGCGWSLDSDLYSRLYALDGSDPAYSTFKSYNPNLWAPNNTNGSKTVRLIPTSYVMVMFFKHTSGYKAMIGLSLYAMSGSDNLSSFEYNSSYSRKVDPGFLYRHVYANTGYYSSSSYDEYAGLGGFFISMIPPANPGDTRDDWHPEYSIHDENFYPPTMSEISYMIHTQIHKNSHCHFAGSSWLHIGTSTAYNAQGNAGVIVGTNMKTCLLLDSIGNVGVSYKYTASSNTTYLNAMIITGPLYKHKFWSNDTLCTRNIGIINKSIIGYTVYSGGSPAYINAAWISNSNGSSNYFNYFNNPVNQLGAAYAGVGSFLDDGSGMDRYAVYTAYPALKSNVEDNFRYAKAGYTTTGTINEDILRWTGTSGLIVGQTYNDSQWIYLGGDYTVSANNGTSSSSSLYPSLRWDGEFNGTLTFA